MLILLTNRREIETQYYDQKKIKIKSEFINLRTSTQMKQQRLFLCSHYNMLTLFSKNIILHL